MTWSLTGGKNLLTIKLQNWGNRLKLPQNLSSDSALQAYLSALLWPRSPGTFLRLCLVSLPQRPFLSLRTLPPSHTSTAADSLGFQTSHQLPTLRGLPSQGTQSQAESISLSSFHCQGISRLPEPFWGRLCSTVWWEGQLGNARMELLKMTRVTSVAEPNTQLSASSQSGTLPWSGWHPAMPISSTTHCLYLVYGFMFPSVS